MPIKSSRFSRMAYARRAALLSEDLAEWHRIYLNRRTRASAWEMDASERSQLEERIDTLQRLCLQLNEVASELVALR